MMLEKKFNLTSFDPVRNFLFVFVLIDVFVIVTFNQSNYDPSKFQPIRDQRFIYFYCQYQKRRQLSKEVKMHFIFFFQFCLLEREITKQNLPKSIQ